MNLAWFPDQVPSTHIKHARNDVWLVGRSSLLLATQPSHFAGQLRAGCKLQVLHKDKQFTEGTNPQRQSITCLPICLVSSHTCCLICRMREHVAISRPGWIIPLSPDFWAFLHYSLFPQHFPITPDQLLSHTCAYLWSRLKQLASSICSLSVVFLSKKKNDIQGKMIAKPDRKKICICVPDR